MNILQCWAVQTVLRSYPAEKLTHSEQAAIEKHIVNCPKCAREQTENFYLRQALAFVSPSPVLDEPGRREMEKTIMSNIKARQCPTNTIAAYPMNLFAEIYEDFRQEPAVTGWCLLFSIICGIFQFMACFH